MFEYTARSGSVYFFFFAIRVQHTPNIGLRRGFPDQIRLSDTERERAVYSSIFRSEYYLALMTPIK